MSATVVDEFAERCVLHTEAPIIVWSIYDHPEEFPDSYVVRFMVVVSGVIQFGQPKTYDTLERARGGVPFRAMRIRFPWMPGEDPHLVESYL